MIADLKSNGMWFSVSLLFKAEYSAEEFNKDPLWEEVIVLLQENSEIQCRKLANQMAIDMEKKFINSDGVEISWKFISIERVFLIEEKKVFSGVLLFSRFLRNNEALSILTPFDDD